MAKSRKYLSANGLLQAVRNGFKRILDARGKAADISLADALMSAFAMFSLKYPSLLAFDRDRDNANLRSIYGLSRIPSDTQMRVIVDEVSQDAIRPLFKDIFRKLQRGKALEPFVFMDNSYLLSLDGTGYFSSTQVHCPSCLEKKNKSTGTVTYSHQMLGAVIVHPDLREVIPLAPEPIIKQDGETKNDCERNAAKRLLAAIRSDHPHLRLVVVEDGLSSNAPHIREILKYKMHYILGAKEGDHPFLFEQLEQAHKNNLTTTFELQDEDNPEITHRFRFLNQVPLNNSNMDLLVNFIEYWEVKPNRTRHFAWVTDFTVTNDNAFQIMRGGRARWKIENETFNTLKNQGYQFEHNFGHGNKNLSVVFAMLMMLAFLVDQVQQLCCVLFQAVLEKLGAKTALWFKVRGLFDNFIIASMQQLYCALLHGFNKPQIPIDDSG